MRKLTKLLALALAVVMLLPATALAADNSANDGPKLMMNWLDWDENGLCYVRDECLSGEDRGTDVLGTAPGDEPCVIFFTVGADGKRTPVIPKAGKGVTIETVEKESIAPNAKQSKYYVRVCLDDWGESEVTSGKATMKVVAQLPDVGFYTTAEATEASYLRNDQQPIDPSQLTDNTVYFVRKVFDDPNQRQIKELKKGSNGSPNMYDLEKVNDNVWKITLKIPEDGGAGVNLDITWQEFDGNTYNEERGCGFEYPHGPELWNKWLDWNEEGPYLRDDAGQGWGFNIVPGDEFNMVFYTCDYDEDGTPKLTPVTPDKLTASKGITLTPLKDESKDKMAEYFVRVTVDDWNMKGTISCGDYSAPVTSNLPDIGIYSKPELTTDSFLRDWRFSPTSPQETVYIGSYIPENDDRVLADLKLADFENSDQFTLEKYNDQFYKLTRKTLNLSGTSVEFDCTWKWPDGSTDTWGNGVWTEPYMTTIISETPFPVPESGKMLFYDDVKDTAFNAITLKSGETKTVYVGHMYYNDVWGGWRVMVAAPDIYNTTGNLTLAAVPGGGDPPKYTLSSSTPGTYQLGLSGAEITLYDKDGKKTTEEELAARNIFADYDFDTGEWFLIEDKDDGPVPYELDEGSRIEAKPFEVNQEWFSATVTVTGEAAKPAFTDVKTGDWFAPAVSYANSKGYMKGNSDTTFNPTGKIKGSEFAQILYNKEGKPAAAEGAAFQGVTDQWYAPAVLWAAGKDIVTDTGDAAVVPTADLTREQIALMLYNYMGKPEAKGDLTAFTDAAKVSAWAKDAMAWAVGEGVLKGSDNALNPTGTATRAETAQILMNFFK